MKILHVFHHYKPCRGGIEKVIMELNNNLSKAGHECSVLCLNRCPRSSETLKAKEKFSEASVERIPFIDLHYYKLAPFSLKKLRGFDLVHVHGLGFFADFLALTKFLHRKPLVLSTHGAIFHTNRISLLKKIYFSVWGRILLKAFSKIVAVSKSDYQLFKQIVNEEKFTVIENAVDVNELKQFQGTPQKNNFLFVGRLSKNKGLYELLEAFAIVKKQMPTFKLRIIGKEFDISEDELKEKMKELGLSKNVDILGEVNNGKLMRTYMISGVFVSASHYEGFGISAIEAMAAGLIPLLNNIPSFTGFVTDGQNGFIVDFSDGKKAAEIILNTMKLSSAERKRLGENAKQFALQFDWGKKAAQYEAVYRECLKC